jgi:ADP-heptose:LPS heptosyltransferase
MQRRCSIYGGLLATGRSFTSVSSGCIQPQRRGKQEPFSGSGPPVAKHLPADLVSQVSEAITRELALDVTYAIGPDDQHLLSDYPTRIRAELLIDPGPLIASAQLFHRYKIFVSTDTGPMHFAVAIGLPALIIFTQAKHKQYGYNDGRRLFTTYYDGRREQQAAFATWLADSLSALKGTIR